MLDEAPVVDSIEAMRQHVAGAPEIYRPGAFWGVLLERNVEMLRSDGIRNFKRTINNNYYNWLVIAWSDPQMRSALRHWIERPTRAPLTARMEPVDDAALRVPDQAFSFSAKAVRRYRPFVAMAWEQARREDRLGLTERLEEPELGNPLRMWSRGRRISQDLANSIVECNYAARSGHVRDGARVAELGAGYGRLAHVFSTASKLVYCIFDIPPALAVSQWYLGELLGPDRVVQFRPDVSADAIATLGPGTVAFFTPDQLERFPDGWFDLTQTISTLPEMPEEQARHFLALLARKSSGEVFLKQWRTWRNELDGVDYTEDRFALPEPWQLVARRVDPIQPRFYNQRWRRSEAQAGCALCGGPTTHALTAWDRNRGVDDARFAYRRCEACGTVQLADPPADTGRYYPADYHGVPTAEELHAHAALEQHKVDLLTAHVEPGRLVEIGPSFGAFAFAAKDAGFDVTGIEMNRLCCDYLEDTVGVRAINSAQPEAVVATLPPSRAIAMWHVLEHVPRPFEVLERAAANLEDGGVLAIAMPNPESLQFRVLGARWAHLDAPRHRFLIPVDTLVDRARTHGLELVTVHTDDPFGRHCNRFGWEYALRRRPSDATSGAMVRRASQVMEKALGPIERRGTNGTAYTVLLRR